MRFQGFIGGIPKSFRGFFTDFGGVIGLFSGVSKGLMCIEESRDGISEAF